MKATRYFSSYIDAYNYYPNGVPSTEIAIVGDSSYILVSSDNAVTGNTTFFDAGMTNDEIVGTMVDTAYATGTAYGETIGYTTGHAAGYSEGYSYGYSYGYTEGEASVPAGPTPVEDEYFTIEFYEQNTAYMLTGRNTTFHIEIIDITEIRNYQYSFDKTTWNDVAFELNENTGKYEFDVYTDESKGNKVYLKGLSDYGIYSLRIGQPRTNGTADRMKVSGNLTSLFFSDDYLSHKNSAIKCGKIFVGRAIRNAEDLIFPTATTEWNMSGGTGCYHMLFASSDLMYAPKVLPAITLATRCYSQMFRGCASLITAPQLPATTLTNECYYEMFAYCTSLTTAPELPATTGADACYYAMFSGCTALVNPPKVIYAINASNNASTICMQMFKDCTSLKKGSIIVYQETENGRPAGQEFVEMYKGCTSLICSAAFIQNSTWQPYIWLQEGEESCFHNMYEDCTSLKYVIQNSLQPEFGLTDSAQDNIIYNLTFNTTNNGSSPIFEHRPVRYFYFNDENCSTLLNTFTTCSLLEAFMYCMTDLSGTWAWRTNYGLDVGQMLNDPNNA